MIIPATGSGDATPTVATDDVGGAHYQRMKLDVGADGASSPLVRGAQTSANSLPVVLASDQAAVTVSGTVTASGTVAATQSGTWNVTNVSGTVSLPTGAATSAKQDTGNTSLSSIDGKITAVNTGAVVVSSSALPSGASTSAKQPALGTAGTPSADVISVQGVVGGTAIPVTATLTSTTITGNVTVVQPTGTNLHAVLDSTSTTAVTQATGTNLHMVVDSGTVTTVGAVTAITNALPAGTNAIGKLAANSGVDIGDVDVTSVSGNVTVVQGTATNLKAEVVGSGSAGTAATGVVTVQGIASMTKLLVTPDANSAINVAQIGGTNTVTGGVNGSQGIGGNLAHDDPETARPVGLGAKAVAHGTNPTAVAANDRTYLYANRAGIPFTLGGHPNILTLEAEYTTAQTNTAIVTVSGGAIIVVTQIQATLDEATTVGVGLRVGFATATTPTTTGVVLTHPGLVPGSGISRGDGAGILGVGADGEDLRITSEVPTTGALRILVSYFTIES